MKKVSNRVRSNTKTLVMTAFFIALGIVLPIAFHAIPNAGKIMLPMHIPVILCGFICGPIYGLLCGILTPILSSAMTGMPPMFPMAVIMLCELATYGFVSGLLIRLIKTKWMLFNIYATLVIALILGRVVSAPMSCALFHIPFNAWVTGTLAAAVPGLVVQILLIPVLLFALERARLIKMTDNGVWGLGKSTNSQKIKEYFDTKAPTWDARSKENDEIIANLLSNIDIKSGDKVLDIACGTGIIDRELVSRGAEVVAIDISNKMIDIAKEKNKDLPVKYIVGDFYEYNESGYDIAIIFNAYPHFVDKEMFITSLSNTLKPNGRFAIVHSLNYKTLNEMHKNMDKSICMDLEAPTKEAEWFKSKFNIDLIVEANDHYILSGTKK